MTLTQQLNEIRAVCLANGIENKPSVADMVRELAEQKEETIDQCLVALKKSNDKLKAGAKS